MAPTVVGKSPSDAVDARTFNLTRGSGLAALIASGVTIFNDTFKQIFGDEVKGAALANVKMTILVAVIAAFAAIAVADLLARAWATAAKASAKALTGSFVIAAAPSKLKAKKTAGPDVAGFTVGAIRFRPSEPDNVEYLLIKSGIAPEWVLGKDLELSVA